ncbi:MAG TPA: arylsulfatase [Clostridiales bacterium]|nr:arylsulfatase [Clostridiales bacterium]
MAKKPNVILMFIDDLGYGDLSCLNENSRISTPNIDALGERGVIYTDAHATSSLCTPSRYGLLTGRYNWRSHLKSGVLLGTGEPLIEPGRMTMAHAFKQSGYFTACVGKWHLGMSWHRKPDTDGSEYGIQDEIAAMKAEQAEAKKTGKDVWRLSNFVDGYDLDYSKPLISGPCDQGFDYFFGMPASLDQPPFVYIENDRVLVEPDHVSGVFPLDRSGPTMQELWQRGPVATGFDHRQVIPDMQAKVIDLIDSHRDEPFFIYYPTPAVHGPLLPTEEFSGKSGLNLYADMVLQLDCMVGEIMQKLKETGQWEETILIFASDNGCSGVADYPFLTANGHNPSYIFRGLKADIYEGGHRVPSIVSWPGQFKTKKICDQMVCHSDFFRTLANLIEFQLPENAGEDSIAMPLLNDASQSGRDTVIHSSGTGEFAIRSKDWKLELCRGSGNYFGGAGMIEPSTSEEMPYQLYNLADDIGERKNRAAELPSIVAKLKNELLAAINLGRTTPGAPQPNTVHGPWRQLDDIKRHFPWED